MRPASFCGQQSALVIECYSKCRPFPPIMKDSSAGQKEILRLDGLCWKTDHLERERHSARRERLARVAVLRNTDNSRVVGKPYLGITSGLPVIQQQTAARSNGASEFPPTGSMIEKYPVMVPHAYNPAQLCR